MKLVVKHNLFSGLTVVAGSIMALHYVTITRLYSGCPAVLALGPSKTGKSTAIKAGLSVTGLYSAQLISVIVHVSVCKYVCIIVFQTKS